nr:zinc finger, RING-CH-type, zinc finger, RING/FYVE/PHD-type [Tanacetum cinerariifolium]
MKKVDIKCEICHHPYQPGYVALYHRPCLEETTIDIGGAWQFSDVAPVLILIALLLLQHASSISDADGGGDGDAFMMHEFL